MSSLCFPGQCSPFKIGSTLKGKNLLLGEQNSSLKELTLNEMGGKIENKRVAFPENCTDSPSRKHHLFFK